MGQLIELVFEGIPTEALNSLVAELLSSEPAFDVYASEFEMQAGASLSDYLSVFNAAQPSSPGTLSLRTRELLIGEASVSQALVQLVRAAGVTDVLIVFEWPGTASKSGQTASSLRHGAEQLALKYGVGAFACGYEPVSDRATLIFDDKTEGPLWWAYASR